MGPGQDQTIVVIDVGTVTIGHPCHLISGGKEERAGREAETDGKKPCNRGNEKAVT